MIKNFQINKVIFLIIFFISSPLNAQENEKEENIINAMEIANDVLDNNEKVSLEELTGEVGVDLEELTSEEAEELEELEELDTENNEQGLNFIDDIKKKLSIKSVDDQKIGIEDGKIDDKKKPILTEIFDFIEDGKKNRQSIMYDEDESKNIRNAFDAFKNNKPLAEEIVEEIVEEEKIEENKRSHIYLGSILYSSQNNWMIWINGEKISNKDNVEESELYIKSISKNSVDIIWKMSVSKWKILTNSDSEEGAPINQDNQVEINFTLGFNQTYVLNGNKIVEGKAGLSFIEKASDQAQSIINSIKDSVDSVSIPNF